MAYVRDHGNQIAIVHGERDPETRKVQQRVLLTIYSKPEAQAALGDDRRRLESLLEQNHPQIRFDWEKIRAGIASRMDALPDSYPYRPGEVLGRFRDDLCAFTRQLGMADPQSMYSAAELLCAHRMELEYVRDLLDWRLQVCAQEPSRWNRDNAFYWRRRLQRDDVPPEVIERMANLWAERDLDRLEALARLFIDCYSDYAQGHNYLGLVAQERGDLPAAIGHFEWAISQGRKLFSKRLAKKYYWSDHSTRPYIRGMRNLAVALMRMTRHDEALEVCARLERECGDVPAANTFRAHIHLNAGDWREAQVTAERVVEIWPEHAYIAAFASLERGDRGGAIGWFLHGVLTRPRTGQRLLGLRRTPPEGYEQMIDHNTGVEMAANLVPFLAQLAPTTRALFEGILATPTTRALLAEKDEVTRRWHEQRTTNDRTAFLRLEELRSLGFAHLIANEVGLELLSDR